MATEIFKSSLYNDSSLQVYLRFKSNALTIDSKDHANLTAISDPVTSTGVFNSGVTFDSNDGYSASDDNAYFKQTDAFSIVAWVNTTTVNSGIISAMGLNSSKYGGWYLDIQNTGTARLVSWKNTGMTAGHYGLVASSTSIVDGNWHLVVVISDGTHLKMFIDNVQEGGDIDWAYNPVYGTNTNCRVGCYSCANESGGANNGFLTGSLGELAIFSKALSTIEISELWAVAPPNPKVNDEKMVVSKEGFDVLSELVVDNKIFDSKYNTLKYYKSGSTDIRIVGDGSIKTTIVPITHALGYVPICIVYVNLFNSESDTDKYYLTPLYASTGLYVNRVADSYIDDNFLYLKFLNVSTDDLTAKFYYKIFKNNLNL
jgi:hypothetical protein